MITPERISRDFPSLNNRVYLNTAAEGIAPAVVGEALQTYFEHRLLGMDGRDFHFAVEAQAREIAARHLGLNPAEVAFCSCSAEAYNLLASALALQEGDEVVINDLDFPSGATPWLVSGAESVRLWKSRNGVPDLADLPPLLNERTRLVQISLVSFYNGHRIALAPFVETVRRHAPQALIAVDVTQALGRVPLDCRSVDIVISSTHKWTLGIHGGGIVGIPAQSAERIVTRAGGWYHLKNAFADDRFARAEVKPGAPGFSVGMPSFAPLYALNASLRYLDGIGVGAIADYANPLTGELWQGLVELGITPLAPFNAEEPSGIVAFLHPRAEGIHAHLRQREIHVMYHAGRIRASLHGYNTPDDVHAFLNTLKACL